MREEIEKVGGLALKFVSPGRAGVPDRIILMPKGKVKFVELKSKEGKESKLQSYMFKKFEKLGFQVKIINSESEIEEILKELS